MLLPASDLVHISAARPVETAVSFAPFSSVTRKQKRLDREDRPPGKQPPPEALVTAGTLRTSSSGVGAVRDPVIKKQEATEPEGCSVAQAPGGGGWSTEIQSAQPFTLAQ